MRAFVTGAHGFVGPWLVRHLKESGDDVVEADSAVDVTDASAIAASIAAARPDAVYHLAALANVAESWADPRQTFAVNATGTLNLLEAVRSLDPVPRVLLVGSAEVYGVATAERLPFREDCPLEPVTPYAASKVAAEYLGVQYHRGFGVPVVRARSFNHVGPGQSGAFVVADIARRVAQARRDGTDEVRVGNLSARRDFTDVRDVVGAYRLLVERGVAGDVYNVCSGNAVAIEELARTLLALAGADMRLVTDPELLRPVDVPVLVGDNSRIVETTGWRPQIPLEQTLSDVLAAFLDP